ncbi:hypothetical protein OH492_23720 [Vibrio chagasii]|nr:hypothetical protein [Vibrio chagasii]
MARRPSSVRCNVFLVGRVFASGARLYMAAIAVSMILFTNIDP